MALYSSSRLSASIASGDALDIRNFQVVERMNELFEVTVVALSDNPDIDFESVVGQAMTFTAMQGAEGTDVRSWTGVCNHIEQIGAEERGLSTYRMVLVPQLWLLSQRRNHRMFQLMSEVDIVRKILGEWGINFTENLQGSYKKRKYRVQYAETDFAFICRMLEDAGIAFYFRTDGETQLVLNDAPQLNPPRGKPIAYRDNPSEADREHVTEVRIGRQIRPGKYVVRDHDYRRPPSYDLKSTAITDGSIEQSLERFHYVPGAFLFESDRGESTPIADDRGKYRTDEKEAGALAMRRLEAQRAETRTVTFDTNTMDLAPGTIVSFLDHPKTELAPGNELLVLGQQLTGSPNAAWQCTCEAVSAKLAYRPPLLTPKPKTSGVESATVVGPAGEEIHTDEFGRVRVHFHWDRESKMDEKSSCWIHVSQPWGGTGFGGTNLPRIGQEVIVDFLGGDPDRPIIIGRVYTNLQKTPYKLPDNKTQSGWQSRSSPGGSASNYNEIMFEDKKGQELVRMQAEKDRDKLVKNDETVRIGHDRTKQVGHDDALQVGNDRTRQVGHDENVQIGNDRTRQVGHDETISIGNDRTRMVGNNEAVSVGNNRSKSIGSNESLFVGANQSEEIGSNRSVQVGSNHSEKVGANKSVTIGMAKVETVGLASAETVGLAKTLTVGAAYAITVGAQMMTNVAMNQTNNVGMAQSETVGTTKTVAVGEKITITCGASLITMDKEGMITISGKDITVTASGVVNVNAQGDVNVQSAAKVNVKGSQIHMN
ncbi:MAG: type VI secretion system tip protein VgrG [Polyangiaceae bacterium]|nr:type VI secretion system tip protein VgrG [Polyangiaceae bacterium]